MSRHYVGPFLAFLPPLAALVFAGAAPAQAGPVGPQFQCGDVTEPSPAITAGDALVVLRTAVGLEDHPLCAADADGNRTIAATDALRTLRVAVGQSISMKCPFCCALCECTPQTLTLTLEDVAPCEGCIPRVPTSGTDVDSVSIVYGVDFNDDYELVASAECTWDASIPGAVAEKILYGSGVSDCSGTFQSFSGSSVQLRVVRSGDGWEVFVGEYALSHAWGDVVRALVESGSCEAGGSGSNENTSCHLAQIGNALDQDTLGIEGSVSLGISDPAPVCP